MESQQRKYPLEVELCEVGARDGFQFESKPIPTSMKVRVIEELMEAGLKQIQITSFVHPQKVPQMSDAEELAETFRTAQNKRLSGLVLNEKGVRRAIDSGIRTVDLSIATNEQHGTDNANMSVDEGVSQAVSMIRLARDAGLEVQLGLQTVWGYRVPGDTPLDSIVSLAERFAASDIESFSLADSTGMANPASVEKVIRAVRAVSDVSLVLHLHDTRGLGLANMVAALELGVDRFDTSMGGLGGCPFIPGASGNVATEDVCYTLDQLGVKTGVDAGKVAQISRMMSDFLGRDLSGKLYTLLV